MENQAPDDGAPGEVPESFSRAVAAVWRAFAETAERGPGLTLGGDAPSGTPDEAASLSLLEALEAAMGELPLSQRVLALALVGPLPVTSPGAPAQAPAEPIAGEKDLRFDGVVARFAKLLRARRLLVRLMDLADGAAADRPQPTASLTESMWSDWLHTDGASRFVIAVAWSLLGRIPLGLDSAESLLEAALGTPSGGRASDRLAPAGGAEGASAWAASPFSRAEGRADAERGEPLLAFAAGRAAALGDPGARVVIRETLVHPQSTDGLRALLVLGLGDGVAARGLSRLRRLAAAALTEEATWARALGRAIVAIGTLSSGAVSDGAASVTVGSRLLGPLPELWTSLGFMADEEEVMRVVQGLRDPLRQALLRFALDRFEASPPPVRAALAHQLLAGRILRDGGHGGGAGLAEAPSALLRERSPAVLSLVLRLLEKVQELIPQDLKVALGRAYSDHPDVGVRKALALALPLRQSAEAKRPPAPGEVIALPPQVLARDDLDRLRVAIWSGESERIVELASAVPLDRRALAREALLAALEIPNAPLRRALVEAVGRIGGLVDAPRLIEAAKRYRALEGTVAQALRALGARAMAEPLAEIYKRRLKWADDEAVDDYCAIAGPEQVIYLRDALETRFYPSARSGAARAIARKKAHEVVFALRSAALSDTQEPARLAALSALHELTGTSPGPGELAGHALLFKPTDELEDAVERAREAGPAAMPGIRRTLARGSWKRRRAACEVLATIPGDEAQGTLVKALQDPDEDVRLAALEALMLRGWQPRTPAELTLQALAARRIGDLIAEPAGVERSVLFAALGLGGHVFRAEVLDAIQSLGFEPTDEEAGALAAARGDVEMALRHPGGLAAVFRAADHTWQANPHRARFVRGLCDISIFEVVDGLDGDRDDWSWRAREAQAQALFRFVSREGAPLDEAQANHRAIDRLAELAGEDDDDVRRAALVNLCLHGTLEAAEAIARGLGSPFQEDRDLVSRALGRMGSVALPVLRRLMGESWWESRHAAALALSHWKSECQVAADHLIVLAVDDEFRVAQTAREALAVHGLLPRTPAIVEAIKRAQTLTVEGLEPWFGLHRSPTAEPEVAHALDQMVEELPADRLPQRLGLIPLFRAEHLALWLEQVALGQTGEAGESQPGASSSGMPGARPARPTLVPPHRHLGVRLAAADALRALTRRACTVCQGERTVRCPGCGGAGDVPCTSCGGKGAVMVTCPDPACTAHGTLRRIDSPRCPTCRGRGEVQAPCSACERSRGRIACGLCASSGRLLCAACEGSGEARFD